MARLANNDVDDDDKLSASNNNGIFTMAATLGSGIPPPPRCCACCKSIRSHVQSLRTSRSTYPQCDGAVPTLTYWSLVGAQKMTREDQFRVGHSWRATMSGWVRIISFRRRSSASVRLLLLGEDALHVLHVAFVEDARCASSLL